MTVHTPVSWANAPFWKVLDDVKTVLLELGVRIVRIEARIDRDVADVVTSVGVIYFSLERPTAAFVFSLSTPDDFRGLGRALNTPEEASREGFRAAFLSAIFDMHDSLDERPMRLPPSSDDDGDRAESKALSERIKNDE